MVQALLKSKAALCYYKVTSGNHYYNEGHVLQKEQLYCKVRQVLQIWAGAIAKWGQVIYFKVGQSLLQRGEDITKWGKSILQNGAGIANWDNYY